MPAIASDLSVALPATFVSASSSQFPSLSSPAEDATSLVLHLLPSATNDHSKSRNALTRFFLICAIDCALLVRALQRRYGSTVLIDHRPSRPGIRVHPRPLQNLIYIRHSFSYFTAVSFSIPVPIAMLGRLPIHHTQMHRHCSRLLHHILSNTP